MGYVSTGMGDHFSALLVFCVFDGFAAHESRPKHLSALFHKHRPLVSIDKVSITHAKAKLTVCSLRSPTLPLQCVSLLSILASVVLMMLQDLE